MTSTSLTLGRLGLGAGLAFVLVFAPPAAWAEEGVDPAELEARVLRGAIEILGGRRTGLAELERVATIREDLDGLQGAIGAGALLLGDRPKALRVLARLEGAEVYYAMAELDGPGGRARARSTLAGRLKDRDAAPGVLFLGALAFAEADQPTRADELLARALKTAPSVLDEAFAPDPAVFLGRSVERAVAALGGRVVDARARLAQVFLELGRRGEALRLAGLLVDEDRGRAVGLRVMVATTNAVEASRTLERVEAILAHDPDAEDAKVAKVLLLARLGSYGRAFAELERLPPIEDRGLRADLLRTKAELLLREGKGLDQALEIAESAIVAEPKNDEVVETYVRILLEKKKVDRAAEFAVALLRRKPRGVDPYRLLADVHALRGEPAKVADNRLRSSYFQRELAKLEREVQSRERVLRAVRDAEAGVGITGLGGLRGEHPNLALPIDLALGKLGSAGVAHAARDRILSACRGAFGALLESRAGWDHTRVTVAPYGEAEGVLAPLSAADPARCRAPPGGRKN